MMRAIPAVHWSRTLLLAAVSSAALAACSPTEPRDFLDARLSAVEDSVRPGAVSVASVEVTNHGSDPIEIEVEVCPPRIFVFDRRGNRLAQPHVACQLSLSAPVTLDPGETQEWAQGWLAPGPPGLYRIQAWVAPVGGGLPVLTNRVAVTVRQPSVELASP